MTSSLPVMNVLGLWGGDSVQDAITSLVFKYGGVYWPLQETSGTVASAIASTAGTFDGATVGTMVGQDAGVLGRAYLFDGLNDYVDIYSVALQNLFNSEAGAVILFANVNSAGVWTDSTLRRALIISNTSLTHSITLRRETTNNTLGLYSGGRSQTVTTSTTEPFCMASTWNKTANEVKFFLNGVQQGSTQTLLTEFTDSINSDECAIGARAVSSPLNVWSGLISHVVLLTGTPLPAEILNIAQLGGVA